MVRSLIAFARDRNMVGSEALVDCWVDTYKWEDGAVIVLAWKRLAGAAI